MWAQFVVEWSTKADALRRLQLDAHTCPKEGWAESLAADGGEGGGAENWKVTESVRKGRWEGAGTPPHT